MRKCYVLLILLFTTLLAAAQDKTIHGRITQKGTRITGANVFVKGTHIGTSSNLEGFYELTVPKNTDSLVVKLVGCETQTIAIGNRTKIDVELQESSVMLKNVAVKGFPTMTTLARRRVENQQFIPEAVVAVTSLEIENAGIEGVSDFMGYVPNASFNSMQNVGTSSLTVRGVTQLRNAEAPVAIVIDGVNVPNPSVLDQDMYDIEQIELVRGPQGALYGKNAIGGALNITTKKPTNSFSNFVKYGYANGNTYYSIFSSSGPIIEDKLLYRISASSKNSDGLIENDYLKKKVDFYTNQSVRGQLTYNVMNNFTADVIGNYTHTKGGATYYIVGYSDLLKTLGGTNGITEAMNASNTSLKPISDELGHSDREIADLSLRLNLGLPFARLTSTTSMSKIGFDYSGDLDFTPLRELLQQQRLRSSAINQEIRLTSNISKNFDWILGGFYQIDKRSLNTLGSLSSAGVLAGLYGLTQTDLANEVLYPIIDSQEKNSNATMAYFGQVSYKLPTHTEFSFGLRYDQDKREQTNQKTLVTREHTFDQLQPKVNISQQVNSHIFAFISYSRGYRSGGFNAPTVIRYPELYKAEYSDNYEIGVKTNWFDNRVIFNVNAFVTNIQHTQLFFVELDGGGQIIVNMGETRNIGGEVEMKCRITNNLDLYASAGLINPKIIKDGITVPESLGGTFEGKYAPQINLNNTNLALQYTIPLNETNQILLRAAHEHRGKLYWHPDNADVQPATEFINLHASYIHKGKLEWKIGAFVDNLFNTKYSGEYVAVEYSGAAFGDIRWPSKPRCFGLNLAINF